MKKPNEAIPEEQRDRLFLKLRKAMEDVNKAYNARFKNLPDDVSVIEKGRTMYPSWYVRIQTIEDELNSYDHTDAKYQELCDRYVKGWTMLFDKVSVSMKKTTKS